MRVRWTMVLCLLALVFSLPACDSGPSESERFESGLQEAIKAADRGKELVKSPGKKH